MRPRSLLTAALLILLPLSQLSAHEEVAESVPAETSSRDTPPSGYWRADRPRIDRATNLFTANTVRKKTFLFIVDHRNQQSIDDEPFHDLLGFDSGGLKIGLGLRYGIWETLDVGGYRLNGTVEPFDVYEFDARYQLLAQKNATVDLAIRPGVSIFTQENAGDSAGGFIQILLSRTFADRLLLGTGLLYHSESSNAVKKSSDDNHATAVQALLDVRLFTNLSWTLESSLNVGGYGSEHPQVTSSLKLLTHRHTFAIVLSNTQYTSADGVATNSHRDFSDIVMGFSITRELKWGEWEKK